MHTEIKYSFFSLGFISLYVRLGVHFGSTDKHARGLVKISFGHVPIIKLKQAQASVGVGRKA